MPDNLKAAVIRAAFSSDEPTSINRSYREVARHYGFVIDPTPPYSPEKKGKVESAVKYVKGSFFGPREIEDIESCNKQLSSWVLEFAGMRTHGTTRRVPLEVFENEERSALKALPEQRFKAILWHEATVGKNSHVAFEKRLFSVPWQNIGAKVWVKASGESVIIFRDHERIATHRRYGTEVYQTNEDHLPEGRRDLRHRHRGHWEARADEMGEEVGAYIREVFDSDDAHYPIRAVAAMIRHLEKVPPERARAACVRASFFANFQVRGLKGILDKGLDQEPLPKTCMSPHWVSNPRFARAATDFLQRMEVTSEPS